MTFASGMFSSQAFTDSSSVNSGEACGDSSGNALSFMSSPEARFEMRARCARRGVEIEDLLAELQLR